ncbi:MAG: choice-of-anchor Q domain-containing protein [Chitinophagales bacterium]
MMNCKMCRPFVILACFALLTVGCRKENFFDGIDAKLRFSTDTLHFDTIFTTIGSATRSFKIYNPYNQAILISSIQLAGGESSIFRMNVDGIPANELFDVEIPANDSLYVFVEVTINPNDASLPYVVEDSIFFTTNGNLQKVILDSWGQNANFIDNVIVTGTEVWTNELPYVIYNFFGVDTLSTLTIMEGCKIYVHGDAQFVVLGTLEVLGTADSNVIFQADRTEDFYKDVPGQWNGISFLRTSKNNIIRYATIKNAINGLLVGYQGTDTTTAFYNDVSTRPQLTLENVQVYDCQQSAMLAVNAEVDATNCLIYNTGESNVALTAGGKYNFTYCTLGNYGSAYLTPQGASLVLTDFFILPFGNNTVAIQNVDEANFTNCISYGSAAEGKDFVISNDGGAAFNYSFTKCFLRTDTSLTDFDDCWINIDPEFANIGDRNYCPDTISQAINAGIDVSGIIDDLVGTLRPQGSAPDVGCYETYVE